MNLGAPLGEGGAGYTLAPLFLSVSDKPGLQCADGVQSFFFWNLCQLQLIKEPKK